MSSQSQAAESSFPSAAVWNDLLRRHRVRPKKRLGQNFLFELSILRRIVDAAELEGLELALEIGAGVGALTLVLAQAVPEVVAVEVDRRLMPALREATGSVPGIRLVEADILGLSLQELLEGRRYVVVANIPYNITSALLRKLMEEETRPEHVVLTVQKELAERVVAGPGDMGLLSLAVQLFGKASIRGEIAARHFTPSPRVDSAILRIDPYPTPIASSVLTERVFALARAGFGQRRKQLGNSLSAGLPQSKGLIQEWLDHAGIDPKRRAQSLSISEWLALAEASFVGKGGAA